MIFPYLRLFCRRYFYVRTSQGTLDGRAEILYDICKHLDERGVDITDTNRQKYASEWFYSQVFREETILPRKPEAREALPAQLLAARSLDPGGFTSWQSREAVFVKQGKLLASYEDDREYPHPVQRYYPTYQSLSDAELRGYFAWRTRLRRGDVQQTSLSYAFLYIYELLNQIGVAGATEGYGRLCWFRDAYGALDGKILPYLKTWLMDYVVYYGLDPSLLQELPQVRFDNAMAVIADLPNRKDAEIMEAIHVLSPRWLSRSKFYAKNREDMDAVIIRVLRGIFERCETRCKRSLAEQYFGPKREYPVRLFQSAVFHDRKQERVRDYTVDPVRVYRCREGLWTVERHQCPEASVPKLEELMKTVDARMRQRLDFGHPVKPEMDTKWLLNLIDREIEALQSRKKAEEAKKLTIDYSRLDAIRRDAAVTRDKLVVDEEEEEAPELPEPEPEEPDLPLSKEEYRLLQCLLYGRPLSWIRQQGLMVSVLADGINEKLFDTFADSVLAVQEPPEVLEDYIDDLKELVQP